MKLNVGCGGIYKKDYINIDAFNRVVADKTMLAENLEIEDNIVEAIEANQVIEHLGIGRAIYAISEFFRVLKEEGKLIIETPDIKRSFEIFLSGKREDRENILPWIYGVDLPGMWHKLCFPEDLLDEILRKQGFKFIKKKRYQAEKYKPILRVTSRKPKDSNLHQILSLLRKRLLTRGYVDLDNQFDVLEKEKVIAHLFKKLKHIEKFYKQRHYRRFQREIKGFVVEGSVRSPIITHEFIDILAEAMDIPSKEIDFYLDILKELNNKHFLKYLLYRLMTREGYTGYQERLFTATINHGKKMVRRLLDEEESRGQIFNHLEKCIVKEDLSTIDTFSLGKLFLEADKFFQLGVKHFCRENFEEAIKQFEISLRLYRNQILTYWNLARLYKLINRVDKAEEYFAKCIKLTYIIDYKDPPLIRRQINIDKRRVRREPITSLTEILK